MLSVCGRLKRLFPQHTLGCKPIQISHTLHILDLLMLHQLNNYITIILWEYIAQIQKTQRISTSPLFLFSLSIPLGSSLKFSAANWLVKQTAVLPLEHPHLHKWSSGKVYTTPPQLPLKTNPLSVHQELNFCQVSPQEDRTGFICSEKTHTRHYVLPDHSLDQLRGLLFLEVLQLL